MSTSGVVGLYTPAQQTFCFCTVAGLVAKSAHKGACGCINAVFLSCPRHPCPWLHLGNTLHSHTGGGSRAFPKCCALEMGQHCQCLCSVSISCPIGSGWTPCAVPPFRSKSSTGEARESLVVSTLHPSLHHLPEVAASLTRFPFPSHWALPLLPGSLFLQHWCAPLLRAKHGGQWTDTVLTCTLAVQLSQGNQRACFIYLVRT